MDKNLSLISKISFDKWWILYPLFSFFVVYFLLDFNGLYGQDGHEYYRYTKELYDFFITGSDPGGFYWPQNYSLISCLLTFITGNVLLSLQLVSLFAFLGLGIILFKILNFIYPNSEKTISIFLSVCYSFSPYLLKAATVVMSDILAMFFIFLSLYNLLKYEKETKIKFVLLFSFSASLAIFTRYVSFVILFIPFCIIGYKLVKTKSIKRISACFVLFIITALPHYFFSKSISGFSDNKYLQAWSITHFFASSFYTQDGLLEYTFPNIIYTLISWLHPRFIGIGLISLIFFKKSDLKREIVVFLSMYLCYSLFLSGIAFQNNRVIMLSFPLILLSIFPSFRKLTNYLSQKCKNLYLPLSGMLLIQMALCVIPLKNVIQRNYLEKSIANAINTNYPDIPIYTFGIDMALASYDLKNPINNLFLVDWQQFETGSLVLFNLDQFGNVFEGKKPMNNWHRLNKQHILEIKEEFGSGWKLYLIR